MNPIEKILEKHLFEISGYSEIRRNVFHIITIDNRELILKTRRTKTDAPRKGPKFAGLYYYLNVSFKWEMHFNRELSSTLFNVLKFPKTICTDGKSYIVFEYITGKSLPTVLVDPEVIVEAIVELQEFVLGRQRMFHKHIIGPLRSVSTSTIRGILSIGPKELGLKDTTKALRVFVSMFRKQKKHPSGGWVHKDLKNDGNYIVDAEGNFYLMDFEMVVNEKKWLLVDIVDLAWNPESLDLDYRLIQRYSNAIDIKGTWQLNLLAQIRVALLRKAIFYTRREKYGQKERERIKRFISGTLLNEAAYNNWIAGQASIKEAPQTL